MPSWQSEAVTHRTHAHLTKHLIAPSARLTGRASSRTRVGWQAVSLTSRRRECGGLNGAQKCQRTFFSNYRELVKPAEAVKWFSIEPETPANVIAAPTVAAAA